MTEMERLPSKDIERMISFINHEADEKIKEMRIKAVQEYNVEKARVIKEETEKMEEYFLQKQKEVEKKRVVAENSLMNMYNQKYLAKKTKIMDEMYESALEICSEMPLDPSLIAQSVEKIDGDFVLYCKKKDRKIIEKQYKNVEIGEMVDDGVGGVILCSTDNTTLVDNSFASRMETAREKFEAQINKIIFKYSFRVSL